MISEAVLNWLAGPDTGASSKSIVVVMERDVALLAMLGRCLDYPRDPSDLGRCIRLLEIEPSYRARIREMSIAGPEWAQIAAHWDQLEALYHNEFPSGTAPRCYEMMQGLIKKGKRDDLTRSA